MKGRTTLIAVIAGVVGCALGVFSMYWFTSYLLKFAQATSAIATVAVEGSALQKMHDDDPAAATRLLQNRLDGELVTIAVQVKAGYTLTPSGAAAIARIRQLRESSGYEPQDPGVRRLVADALSLGASR
jgi:hypothetical protein